jgi:hypothetical protein
MRRSTTTVLGLVAATSLLTACGSSATDARAHSVRSADSTGRPTTSLPSGPRRQFAESKGAWDLVLRDVRVSEHEGFDRVVVEFEGTGTPGWGARYVKTPRADGSGVAVDVHGDSFLGVSISGVTIRKRYPETPADFFRGRRHFMPEHGGRIADVNVGGVFEGYSQLFLGIDGDQAPFRVFARTSPSRLVVEVHDE